MNETTVVDREVALEAPPERIAIFQCKMPFPWVNGSLYVLAPPYREHIQVVVSAVDRFGACETVILPYSMTQRVPFNPWNWEDLIRINKCDEEAALFALGGYKVKK